MHTENAVTAAERAARRGAGQRVGRPNVASAVSQAGAARSSDVITPAQLEPLVAGIAPYVQGCVDAYRTGGLLSREMAGAVLSVSRALGRVDARAVAETASSGAERSLGTHVGSAAYAAPATPLPEPKVASERESISKRTAEAPLPLPRTDSVYKTFYGDE